MTQNQQKKLKAKITEELAVNPIVESACRKSGLARATYYRWLKDDADFYEAVELAQTQGRDRVNDMAESAVMKGIKAEDFRFVKYWLEHNHRRYIKKRAAKRPFIKLRSWLKNVDREEDW